MTGDRCDVCGIHTAHTHTPHDPGCPRIGDCTCDNQTCSHQTASVRWSVRYRARGCCWHCKEART